MKPFPLLPRWSTCLASILVFALSGPAAKAATDEALPLPWLNQDVGDVGVEGSSSFDAGAFTVLGSGVDIWGTADEFQFVYQPLSGDGTILARVVSQHNTNEWAKAGVMIRETLDADSRFAMMTTTPEEGLAFQYRETPAAEAVHVPGALVPYPYWVLLVRSGDSFTGYVSPDGVDWTEVGTTTLPMNADVFIGLCVTSHNDAYLSTAVFDSVAVTGGADLAVDVLAGPDSVGISQTLTYTLTVTNAGPADAAALSLTDDLPPGATLISAAGDGWDCTGGGPVVCTLPALGVETAAPVTITLTAPSVEGDLVNEAAVSSATSDANPENNSAETTSNVSANADLALTQFGTPEAVCPGQPITYTVNVFNSGPAAADSVTVTDTLPDGASLISVTGSGWDCSGTNPLLCSRGTLAPGAAPSIVISLGAAVSAGLSTNSAVVASSSHDPLANDNSFSASVTVNATPETPVASNSGPACEGELVQLSTPTVTGASYSWTGPNGFASVLQNPSFPATFAAAGLYSVTVTVAGCSSAAGTTTVNVRALPSAAVSGDATLCQGGTTQIQAVLAGTSPWTVQWSDGVTQSGVLASPAVRTVGPASTTVYTVTAVSDAFCAGAATGSATVTVGDPVAAPVLTAPSSVAVNTEGVMASVPLHAGSTYAWTLTGGTITGGQGTAQVTFDAGTPGTTMVLQVTETNTTCVSPAAEARVQVDFVDVPPAHEFHDFIATIARNAITAGCQDGTVYCPEEPNTRAQMAVFLLKSKFGADHVPPPATGTVFDDVQPGDFAAAWIEELASLGITSGCGGTSYCPGQPVTRGQMAIFLLKASLGAAYVPPPAQNIFEDVPADFFAIDWVEDLYNREITSGCLADPLRYCPEEPNTRGQMAVFLTKTFDLQ